MELCQGTDKGKDAKAFLQHPKGPKDPQLQSIFSGKKKRKRDLVRPRRTSLKPNFWHSTGQTYAITHEKAN